LIVNHLRVTEKVAEASMQAHDIRKTLSTLPEMEFAQLADFNEGGVGVFWATGGRSPWELHPDDDKLLQIVEGEVVITVLTDDGPVETVVSAGSCFVVPRGHWHRQELRGKVLELYVTPGRSKHSHAEDPRTAGGE
jgi:mannose-6-phosphate isomerase-like protein (cupin superfamily)